MAKYEIMIIVDPKEDLKNIETLTKEVFESDLKNFTKMDKTELAYEINNSKTAHFVLIDVETNGLKIKEFTRRVNISKTIWRELAINLDTERAKDSWANMKKFQEFKARRAAERTSFSKTSSFSKETKTYE